MTDVASKTVVENARAFAGRFCVLVSSSDYGRDIFEIVFQNS
jgi:hypothetical protein